MASIWNKQHLCWRKFTQPAVRMTQCTERANVSECCVTVGLAHSKFPFLWHATHAHIPATQFQFLKRMRCLCRDVWSSGEEAQQASHSESSTCLLLLVEKGTRLQWYKYNGAGVKMCFSGYERNCYVTVDLGRIQYIMFNHFNSSLALVKAIIS